MTDDRVLRAALASFVQEHMPWPFADISRHGDEATDTAWAIADRLAPRVAAEFASVAQTARDLKRRTYPKDA